MRTALVSQIAPFELIIAAHCAGQALAQYLIEFEPGDFSITWAARPYILFGDPMAVG